MNKRVLSISIFATLLGIFLNRYFSNHFGRKGVVLIMSILIGIGVCCWLSMIVMKQYHIALAFSSIVIPILIMFFGILFNNDNVALIGILLLFILAPITLLIIKKKRNS